MATEKPLKMMKKSFYFSLKTIVVLKNTNQNQLKK